MPVQPPVPNRRRSRLTLAVLTALLANPLQAQTTAADPAGWVPPDALAYAGVIDLREFIAQAEASAGMRLWKDPAARDLNPQAQVMVNFFEGFQTRLAELLKTSTDSLRNPLGGNVAIYARLDEGRKDEPIVAFVSQIADAQTLRSYFETATDRLREVAQQHEKIDFAGQTILYYQTKAKADDHDHADDEHSEGDPNSADSQQMARMVEKMLEQFFSEQALPPELALCLTEDRLIVSNAPDEVKAILRRERTGETLAAADGFREGFAKFEKPGLLRFFLNTPELLKLAAAEEGDAAQGRKMFSAMGLDELGPVVAHARYESAGDFESVTEMLAVIRGERRGLVKLMCLENKPIEPPPAVTEDAFWYAWANIDPKAIVEESERMMRAFDTDAAQAFVDGLGEVPADEGTIHIRRDIIENLAAPFQFCAGFAAPPAPENARVMLSIGHRNPDAIRRVVGQLATMLSLSGDREVAGNPMYDTQFRTVALGVGRESLTLGDPASVQRVLQGDDGRRLAESPDFRKLAGAVGGEAGGYVFVDPRRALDAAAALADKRQGMMMGGFSDPVAAIALALAESFTGPVEPKSRDAVRSLRQYMHAGLIASRTTADGILITAVNLRAAK